MHTSRVIKNTEVGCVLTAIERNETNGKTEMSGEKNNDNTMQGINKLCFSCFVKMQCWPLLFKTD